MFCFSFSWMKHREVTQCFLPCLLWSWFESRTGTFHVNWAFSPYLIAWFPQDGVLFPHLNWDIINIFPSQVSSGLQVTVCLTLLRVSWCQYHKDAIITRCFQYLIHCFYFIGGVYIPSQQQQQVANGYPTNSTMPGYQVAQQQQPQQPNGMPGYGVGNNQAMIGQQQGMMGHPQSMMGQQQGMMGQPQGMMGQPQGMMGQQQGMMGQQQGMVGNQGMIGMYGAPAGQQQSAYLQQIQQQMSSMRVGSSPPLAQVQQPGWQSSNSGFPQQQPVPNAVAGMGGWGGPASSSGQTLSNQLWKWWPLGRL